MNQTPEQIARDQIDQQLEACGWKIQSKKQINLAAGLGIAVREYQTDIGPADYVLFVDKKPVGVIEAKREEEGFKLITVEEQSHDYATAKLKYLQNASLPFVYESTGKVTRFTDYRDPKPRSREVFTFHRPETLKTWIKEASTLRSRLFNHLPALPEEGMRDCQITAINNLDQSFRENRPKALIQDQIVQEIESRLSVCDKMEETITTSLQQAEALRQSILKKAFEGKLVGQFK